MVRTACNQCKGRMGLCPPVGAMVPQRKAEYPRMGEPDAQGWVAGKEGYGWSDGLTVELVYDKPVNGHRLLIWMVTDENDNCWFEGEHNGWHIDNMSGPYLVERLTEDL